MSKFAFGFCLVLSCLLVKSCKSDEQDDPVAVLKWNAEHRNHTDFKYDYGILDMSFSTEKVGWAVGNANWTLFRFNGRHWEIHSEQTEWAGGLTAVCSVNDSIIYLASEKGGLRDSSGKELEGMNIRRSTDAGQTWRAVYNQKNDQIRITKLFFINEQVGFGLKGNPDAIPGINLVVLRTRDGGKTWDNPQVAGGGSHWRFTDIHFWDEQNGIICGTSRIAGLLFTTEDGGSTWTRRHPPEGVFDELWDLEAAGDQVVYTSAKGKIYRSNDRGKTWVIVSDMTKLPFNHEQKFTKFISENEGYAFGAGYGTIEDKLCSDLLRTSDGGKSWTRLILSKEPDGIGKIANYIPPDDAWIWPNTQDVWIYGHAVDRINGTGTVIGYFGQMFFFQSWN